MEMRSLCLHEVHDISRLQTRIMSGWCIGLGLLQGSRGVLGDLPTSGYGGLLGAGCSSPSAVL